MSNCCDCQKQIQEFGKESKGQPQDSDENPDRFINECGLNYENVPSLNNLLEFLPISKDELFKKFPDADIGLLEKILLEGILKGEIFYLDSLIFKKDD